MSVLICFLNDNVVLICFGSWCNVCMILVFNLWLMCCCCLLSVVISINNVISWVVKVLVEVILILVFVWVIKVKFDLCMREEFVML